MEIGLQWEKRKGNNAHKGHWVKLLMDTGPKLQITEDSHESCTGQIIILLYIPGGTHTSVCAIRAWQRAFPQGEKKYKIKLNNLWLTGLKSPINPYSPLQPSPLNTTLNHSCSKSTEDCDSMLSQLSNPVTTQTQWRRCVSLLHKISCPSKI